MEQLNFTHSNINNSNLKNDYLGDHRMIYTVYAALNFVGIAFGAFGK